ncbi:tubulin-folding cofactor B isoform X2 [Dendrobium catenatum]|uniref:tubulin-folding cofactor B isoform X2 n=1 Tax=Dendrobium catenatum TaxID=906689 RepID=UPI0009F38785|nr:tubulin-folding cofactor B isoform X2 [Dendrobium catenatum]
MASRLQLGGDKTVLLRVTHSNIKGFSSEVRFDLEMSVEAAKEKLWKKCGTSVDSMLLVLYDDVGSKICDLSDNASPLGFYFPLNGYHIKVIDQDPSSVSSGGWLDDTSLVEKYKISEEAYNKLDSNFRKFKEKMLSQNAMTHEKKVGDRCEVEPGEKRGVVKFVGKVENRGPGFWIGIQLDEPLGKHDGMVNGKRYFECLPQHGILLRPEKVKVGDYPERDPFDEEEI